MKQMFILLKKSFQAWLESKASRLAAAIAFYTMLSLAPLALIAVAVFGLFTSPASATQELLAQIEERLGPEVAHVVGTLLANAQQPTAGTMATIIGLGVLAFGATGVVASLKWALDTLWGEDTTGGHLDFIKHRAFAFVVVLGACLLLFALVAATTVISALAGGLPGIIAHPDLVLQGAYFLLSVGFTTVLIALVFRVLPGIKLPWKPIWAGAAFTAFLFTIGQTLIGLYLARSSTTSVYGAAGSIVALLVWAYYSAQIVLFGAAFTATYAALTQPPTTSGTKSSRPPSSL